MSIVLSFLLAGLIVFIHDTQCATWRYSCPTGWTYYSGSCYTLIKEKQPWAMAQEICEAMGANLATISDKRENNEVTNLARQASISDIDTQMWIGMHDQVAEGRFAWIHSNREAKWSHWAKSPVSEPNNLRGKEDCMSLRPDGYWNDAPCSMSMMYICELIL